MNLIEKFEKFYSNFYCKENKSNDAKFSKLLKELIGEFCYKKYRIEEKNMSHKNEKYLEGAEIIIKKLVTMKYGLSARIYNDKPQPVGSLSKYYVEGRPGDDGIMDMLELVEQIYQDWIDGKIEL
ncbi:MAG: hypothetical protein ACOC1K_02860 [Nanoarchaeota archaeon]